MPGTSNATALKNLMLRPGGAADYPLLRRVDDYLIVATPEPFCAPLLTEVGGCMVVYPDTSVRAPVLESVRGGLLVFENAIFEAPSLIYTGPSLTLRAGSTVRAPLLKPQEGELCLQERSVLRSHRGAVAKSGDTAAQFKRRYIYQSVTSPHGMCERAGRCVEHERDPRVAACEAAAGGR